MPGAVEDIVLILIGSDRVRLPLHAQLLRISDSNDPKNLYQSEVDLTIGESERNKAVIAMQITGERSGNCSYLSILEVPAIGVWVSFSSE